jgi:hypothetical protein
LVEIIGLAGRPGRRARDGIAVIMAPEAVPKPCAGAFSEFPRWKMWRIAPEFVNNH